VQSFQAYLLTILKATVLAICSIAGAGIVWIVCLFAFSSNFRDSLFQMAGLRTTTQASSANADPGSLEDYEISQLGVDHYNVINWIMTCTRIQQLSDQPQYIQSMFSGAYDVGLLTRPPPSGPIKDIVSSLAKTEPPRLPNQTERALMNLSFQIWKERYTQRLKTRSAYSFWQITTFVTIGLGMLTTILISLSSTTAGQGQGKPQQIIRTLAIVFPAVGTAAAAVIAFYGPQNEWSHSSRVFDSLSQLHDDMALGVWRLPDCSGAVASVDEKTKLTDWTNSYLKATASPANPTAAANDDGGKEGKPSIAPGGGTGTPSAPTK